MLAAHAVLATNGSDTGINALLKYVSQNATRIGVQVGLTALIVLLAIVVGPWLAHFAGQMPVHMQTTLTRNGRQRRAYGVIMRTDGLGRWLSRVTVACVWVAALVIIGIIWTFSQGPTTNEQAQILLAAKAIAGRIGGSLIVIAVTLGFASFFQRTFDRALERSHVDPNLTVLIGRVLYITLLVVGLVIIFAVWGVGIVIPVTLIGVLTVALSLALQDILKNIVAGVYLLIERPFLIGDFITIAPYSGTVEDILIRVTWLRTVDGERVVVPNALLFTSPVVNQTAYQTRRAGLLVTLAEMPQSGLQEVERAIYDALDDIAEIKDDPRPQVALSKATSDKVELQVVFWTPAHDGNDDRSVVSEAIERVRLRLPGAEVAALDSAASAA